MQNNIDIFNQIAKDAFESEWLSLADKWDQYLLGMAMKSGVHRQSKEQTIQGMAKCFYATHYQTPYAFDYSYCIEFANDVLDNKVDLR